jgi:hypothetical protein
MFCLYKGSSSHLKFTSSSIKPNRTKSAVQAMAARARIGSFLSALVVLFLFAGSSHAQNVCDGEPCILVSNFGTGNVQIYSDDGSTELSSNFLNGGGGGGEGMTCTAGTNNNVIYVSNNGPDIAAYSLQTGAPLSGGYSGTGSIAGLTINAAGNVIYAGEYGATDALVLSPPPSGPPYPLTLDLAIGPQGGNDSHDVALGTYPPSLAGDLFTSYFPPNGIGVNQFDLNSLPPYNFGGEQLNYAGSPSGCAMFNMPTPTQHCWTQVSGIEFDAAGNLWANSATYQDNGTFEFTQVGSSTPIFAPVNFVPSFTTGDFPVGLTIAPATDPLYPGYILTADFLAGQVSMISPASCTGTTLNPGTCTRNLFFSPGGNPKYVQYNVSCPNIDNDGYVEVCKQSNPAFPVTGTFDFTITAPQYSSGVLSVPVGECSGPIQVPSGTVTISETPTAGDTLSDVSAYSYTANGSYVDQLVAFPAQNPPNPSAAEVATVPGNNVALETIATFTNSSSAGQTGLLKICKIAGTGVADGTPFSFATSGAGTKNKYSIEAGPADQGGYCELAGSYPVGSQIKITETVPKGIYASIQVQPPANGGTKTATSVVVTIGQGVTVAEFTDSTQKPSFTLSANPNTLTVGLSGTGTSAITINPAGGFSGNVTLTASGLPAGVTASFTPNPATSTSTVTFTASATAALGTKTVTIKGTSGALSATTTIALTVVGSPNFTLSASPTSLKIPLGGTGTSTITITPTGGFDGEVTLNANGLPKGMTASFSPDPATSTSTLTIDVSDSTTPGTYAVSVSGTSGSLSNSTTIKVTVTK